MPMAGEPISVLIDALNVAYWRGSPPSLRLPVAVAEALRRHGHTVQLIFDASAPHKLPPSERDAYAALLQSGLAIEMPSGIPADRQLLRLARASGAAIISRDRFHDHRSRYRRLIDDPARLVDGFVDASAVKIPALGINAPLIDASAQCPRHDRGDAR